MVALPAFKFVFLAIRQVTRPVARQIVSRANTKKGATYQVCVCLGRVSLGLTGVIAEWNQAEAAKREAEAKAHAEEKLKKNAEEAAKAAAEATKQVVSEGEKLKDISDAAAPVTGSGLHPSGAPSSETEPEGKAVKTETPPPPTAKPTATPAAAPSTPEKAETVEKAPTPNLVTPRSRPLLTELMYGPIPRPPEHEESCQNIHKQDTYDENVFYDKNRTVGEVARVFIRYPSRSAWDVFRRTFLSPFPEQRLVDAGADFLIELTAYVVLASLLFLELWQQSKTTAAKEAYLQQRLSTIEEKVNELVQLTQEASNSGISALDPAPELAIRGRVAALWHLAESSIVSVGSLITPFMTDTEADVKPHAGSGGQGVVVCPPVRRRDGQLVPEANLPRSAMEKPSKHDDTALMKRELEMMLRENGLVEFSVSAKGTKDGK